MKIPKSIKIGWRKYKVVYVKDLQDAEGNDLLGQINYNANVIRLESNNISEDYGNVVFLHEVVHGLFNSLGLNEQNDNEDIVDGLSEIMYQVIKENKLMESDN
ncbi:MULTISPECIES: hypothetical protein [Clostridium]|uniref:Phage protein n=1 Tax=Clostridium frigoriphilum TaxID=443253 RepID=A0ABU7UX17_9CLOT|nr:hypothetical protein [Clostridium sp. DSM 17811]MBU3098731.1 hypothetical protein [Clostridium sp. DSM 17811]